MRKSGKQGAAPRQALYVELADIRELGRLSCAMERVPLPILAVKSASEIILATQLDSLLGLPIFYFSRSNELGHFLAYRNSAGLEEVHTKKAYNDSSYIYSPIISVKKLPKELAPSIRSGNKSSKMLSVELSDLPSLAKLCTYRTLFDEPPLSLFAYREMGEWVVGAYSKMDDQDDDLTFFYHRSTAEPTHGFLRYSASSPDEATYTNRIDQHGYVFIKTMKLTGRHPLVDTMR